MSARPDSSPDSSLYRVAVDAPLSEALTYLPPTDGQPCALGQSVFVPLGKRQAHGVVVEQLNENPKDTGFALKAILAAHPDRPALPKPYLDWTKWLSQYYVYPLGQIVETLFPPLPKNSNRKSRKAPVVQSQLIRSEPPQLTAEQKQVLEALSPLQDFQVHLLQGVTGSGKTEVYLHVLDQILARGQQGLVLVPEISLTPQLIDRFSKRFPDQVAVLHSHLTERERTDQWWSVVDGQKNILIGARSALFCPLPRLGAIVLDEEHEPSYKQDEKLKYHARDAAIVLAQHHQIPILLGSATPSLESWQNAQSGKYRLHKMVERVQGRHMPEITVVDLRDVHRQRKETPSALPFWLSDLLHQELCETFARGDQAALFLNRRGVAQTAQCHSCGFVSECPNCSVSLTVHGQSHLVCHYCDYTERLSELCPDCKESPLEPLGMGTERIEKDIAQLFPEITLARADRDEIQSRDDLETLVREMESGHTQLLIGTQMIAKGLDFPKLNLVGLVLADVGFHWPDFRASERSFQLLTQVAGRSGRATQGKVIIQTYNPEHPCVPFTVRGDYEGFARAELQERTECLYPPYWRMAMIRIQSQSESIGELTCERLLKRALQLQSQSARYQNQVQLLGPTSAPLFRLRNKYRYQMLIKGDSAARINSFCRQLLSQPAWLPKGTKVQVDIDPLQML